MLKKFLLIASALGLSFGVLTISVFRSASVIRVFPSVSTPVPVLGVKNIEVSYQLPFPGYILPGNILWYFKALRDEVWYSVTGNPLKKAEVAVLFADKRLAAAELLLSGKKSDVAISTLTKGEKYLEVASDQENAARRAGFDTSEFLTKLASASLKHRQIIENEILPVAPDGARPEIVKAEDYSKNAFKAARDALGSKGLPIPESPFSGD